MFRRIIQTIYIYCYEKYLCSKHGISNADAVLVLSGENKKIDDIAIAFFSEYMSKRHASKGYIVVPGKLAEQRLEDKRIQYISLSQKRIKQLYQLYCFYKFSENIVFTNVRTPNENKLTEYLDESDLTEEDIIRFALYRLE